MTTTLVARFTISDKTNWADCRIENTLMTQREREHEIAALRRELKRARKREGVLCSACITLAIIVIVMILRAAS